MAQQHPHHLHIAPPARAPQQRRALRHDLPLHLRPRPLPRPQSLRLPHTRARLQQQPRDPHLLPLHRNPQRLRTRPRATVQQHPRHLHVPKPCRRPQRRALLHVRIRPGLQQHPRDLREIPMRREPQRDLQRRRKIRRLQPPRQQRDGLGLRVDRRDNEGMVALECGVGARGEERGDGGDVVGEGRRGERPVEVRGREGELAEEEDEAGLEVGVGLGMEAAGDGFLEEVVAVTVGAACEPGGEEAGVREGGVE
mmetsp:Transcript_17931/g.47680  ORF Transcript_17931/g.47680 Transcript_17931/m.47680 type:complete len:253 (-) Transcript_17931:12-770(-)